MGDYKFEGWAGYGPDSVKGNMKYIEFEPVGFDDDYVDGEWSDVVCPRWMVSLWTGQTNTAVKVQYSGICGSDTSQLGGHLGEYKSPIICGHEIVGEVVKAGPKANLKVGDLVGIGAQGDCCRECEWCQAGESTPHYYILVRGPGTKERGLAAATSHRNYLSRCHISSRH